jgi:hypothetical protein
MRRLKFLDQVAVLGLADEVRGDETCRQHTLAYASIRQHTPAYGLADEVRGDETCRAVELKATYSSSLKQHTLVA